MIIYVDIDNIICHTEKSVYDKHDQQIKQKE